MMTNLVDARRIRYKKVTAKFRKAIAEAIAQPTPVPPVVDKLKDTRRFVQEKAQWFAARPAGRRKPWLKLSSIRGLQAGIFSSKRCLRECRKLPEVICRSDVLRAETEVSEQVMIIGNMVVSLLYDLLKPLLLIDVEFLGRKPLAAIKLPTQPDQVDRIAEVSEFEIDRHYGDSQDVSKTFQLHAVAWRMMPLIDVTPARDN